MDPEPQKNGKTINWCTVDVAGANGTGEPQGIVCGATTSLPATWSSSCCLAGCCPVASDLRAQDLTATSRPA